MPMPVRSLPVVQNWDCGGCGECCQSYHIPVSDAERARIDGQGWRDDPALADVPFFVWDKHIHGYRLNHRADNKCVFLGADNQCKIHDKFGSAAKPRACRIYPFALVPAGDHWRVGLRYACPAAVANSGRPMRNHQAAATEYAALLEAEGSGSPADTPPTELLPGQSVPWPDLVRFVEAIAGILGETTGPIEHRMRRVIALAGLCRKSRFETVRGSRLKEFLDIVSAALDEDVVARPEEVLPPGWVGRVIFRQTTAAYCRKDWGPHAGIAVRGRWPRFQAAWRFALGRGRVPRIHARIPDTTFAAAEQPAGPVSQKCDALLTRYYRVKVESMQFCGPTNFGRRFWEGLDSLVLTFPVVMWLGRVLSAGGAIARDEAVAHAVQIVDDNFGFNTQLGTGRQLWATGALSERGELARLVAWYAR